MDHSVALCCLARLARRYVGSQIHTRKEAIHNLLQGLARKK